MDDYLTKPLRPELLREALTRWTGADEERLVERPIGNEALAKRIAGAFIDNMPQQLAALAAASEIMPDLAATFQALKSQLQRFFDGGNPTA